MCVTFKLDDIADSRGRIFSAGKVVRATELGGRRGQAQGRVVEAGIPIVFASEPVLVHGTNFAENNLVAPLDS